MSFHQQEKQKRIEITKMLRTKGYTIEQLAQYFGVKQETVMEYIRESDAAKTITTDAVISKQEPKPTLFSYAKETVAINKFFQTSSNIEGFQCPICRRYRKYEAGKKWNKDTFVCIDCFASLTPEQRSQLL